VEIVRDFNTELIDAKKLANERIILRAMTSGVISKISADQLLKELWHHA